MQQLEALLTDFNAKYSSSIEEITHNAKKMKIACDRVKDSWSGSCIGFHSKLYYRNFQKPPRGEMFSVEWGGHNGISEVWGERTSEDVKKAIGDLVGKNFSVDSFEKAIENLAGDIEDFEINVELLISSIAGKNSTHPLAGFERVEPKKKLKSFIKSSIPQNVMTRDSEALAQGIMVPAIIYYEAVIYEAESLVSNIQQFLKKYRHFITWFQLQNTEYTNPNLQTRLLDISLFHPAITSKCQHLFETGAYPEAVEKSFKVVRDRLRSLTSHETGSEAFGKGKLHIKGAAATNVDHDFNEGVKFLTMAIDKFRNEKSHTSDGNITDPQHAYEYLTLSSLAMHLLDRAEITT